MDLHSRLKAAVERKQRQAALVEAVKRGAFDGVFSGSDELCQRAERAPGRGTLPASPSRQALSFPEDFPPHELVQEDGGRIWVFDASAPVVWEPIDEGTLRCPVREAELAVLDCFCDHVAEAWPETAADGGPVGLEEIAFIDTETTGLAGGTGTVAFLVGLGWFEGSGADRRFRVRQYLMGDYCDEPLMLGRLLADLAPFRLLASFNGRSFDVPILRTRCVMNRIRPRTWSLPHVDLLHFSRRLWKGAFEDVRLQTLERELFGIERVGDIPGAEIPAVWMDFARTGRPGRLASVVRHNAQDIASLGALVARQLRLATQYTTRGVVERPSEFLGLARWREARRDFAGAALLVAEAVGTLRDPDEERAALLNLGRLRRRNGDWEGAVDAWRAVQSAPLRSSWPAWIELAKYLEHRARDLGAARRLVADALRQAEFESELALALGRAPGGIPETAVADLARRKDRITQKIRRREGRMARTQRGTPRQTA